MLNQKEGVSQAPAEWIQVPDYPAGITRSLLSIKPQGSARIIPCSASLDVFNTPSFMEAAREVRRSKSAQITVLTGPIIEGRDDGSSGLLELAAEGTLELVQQSVISYLNHMYLIDQDSGDELYVEQVHAPFALEPQGRMRWNPEFVADREWQHRIGDQRYYFDTYAASARQAQEEHKEIFKPIPLLTTPDRLQKLLRFCADGQIDLFYLTPSAILALPISEEVFLQQPT